MLIFCSRRSTTARQHTCDEHADAAYSGNNTGMGRTPELFGLARLSTLHKWCLDARMHTYGQAMTTLALKNCAATAYHHRGV